MICDHCGKDNHDNVVYVDNVDKYLCYYCLATYYEECPRCHEIVLEDDLKEMDGYGNICSKCRTFIREDYHYYYD